MKRVWGRWRTNKIKQPFTLQNSIELVPSGRIYFDCIEKHINSANHEIHLQAYIFASDDTGSKIIEALIRAAKRKVEVFLLVDAFGSQNFSADLIDRITNAGVHFRKFGELYSKGTFHLGRRMHHKIAVFDGHVSIVGGINISDDYNDTPGNPAWLDFAVIMQGNVSRRLQFLCRQHWNKWVFSFRSRKKLLKNSWPENKIAGFSPIRIRTNDFIRNKNDIANSYRQALRYSEKSILIVGGYFLPGGRTRRLMKSAIKRGVIINVVVSEKSDVRILDLARKYLYGWLIRNGIQVYEYKPSNVHGKVIISDEMFTSIGSYDLNNLSTYSNIELNVDINDETFSKSMTTYINKIIQKDCIKLDGENMYKDKTQLTRLLMWLSYRFVKTLFVLSILLSGKKEKKF